MSPIATRSPKRWKAKYSRVRVPVTGQKRKTGSKGQKRPASYGSGKRTRAVAALDQIYAAEGVPPLPSRFAAGEQAMLERHRVADYAAHIRQAHRVARQ